MVSALSLAMSSTKALEYFLARAKGVMPVLLASSVILSSTSVIFRTNRTLYPRWVRYRATTS